MFKKLQHLTTHMRVLKFHYRLIPRIVSGYVRTLLLRKPVLRTVEFTLLAECNSRCEMCYASKLKRTDVPYLSVDEYRKLWKQASKLGVFSAILSGGEPTLRKDLFEIIAALDPQQTIIALVTNSLNLDLAFLKKLKRSGVNVIHLSLDSSDEATNDRIRGAQGHYRKVMDSIANAKSVGLSVYLSTVIMHNGIAKMKEMVEFARTHNIGIVFSLACISGNWSEQESVLLSAEEWSTVQQYMRDNPFIRSDWTINFSMRQECPGGREKLCISPYGDVMGCGMNYISFGSAREEPLEKIWKRARNFPEFKRRSRNCLIGADRSYIETYIKPLSAGTVPVRIDRHPKHPITLEKLDEK